MAQEVAQAAHVQMRKASQQRDEANRRTEASEAARTRTMVLAGRQAADFGHREEEYLH